MKGKPKGKEAPKKEQAGEKARPSESDGGPTIIEVAHMGVVKNTAVGFISMTDQVFNNERERAIAAWAYAFGMAKALKMTEKTLGTFGASTVFGSIAEAVPVTKCDDGHGECEICHQPWTAGDDFDKLEKLIFQTRGKQASGRFDPMYM